MTERLLALDAETDRMLDEACRCMGFQFWDRVLGRERSRTIRIALDHAERRAFKPDPEFSPAWTKENGKSVPKFPAKVDLDGRFEHYDPKEIASILRTALRHFLGNGKAPDDKKFLALEYWLVELDDQVIREISIRAFEQRRTVSEQMALVLERAESRKYPQLPDPKLPVREISAPVLNPELHTRFRNRAMALGIEAEVLAADEIRQMVKAGEMP